MSIADVTSGLAQLTVQGPRSREVLRRVTSADLSDAAFPFRAAREVDLGFARGLCTRITYVGELGYELFVPAEMAVHVHDELVAAGARPWACGTAGLAPWAACGWRRPTATTATTSTTPTTCSSTGLGFTIAWDKPGGFLGRDAAARPARGLAADRPAQRLVQVLLADPEPLMVHAEVLLRDGVAVGYLRSASYGFTLGGAVGLAMVEGDGSAGASTSTPSS